jgi:hypothetical protein
MKPISIIDNAIGDLIKHAKTAAGHKHQLAPRLDLIREALKTIVLNAELIPDPNMGGFTDIYAVPIEDIERAKELLGMEG